MNEQFHRAAPVIQIHTHTYLLEHIGIVFGYAIPKQTLAAIKLQNEIYTYRCIVNGRNRAGERETESDIEGIGILCACIFVHFIFIWVLFLWREIWLTLVSRRKNNNNNNRVTNKHTHNSRNALSVYPFAFLLLQISSLHFYNATHIFAKYVNVHTTPIWELNLFFVKTKILCPLHEISSFCWKNQNFS